MSIFPAVALVTNMCNVDSDASSSLLRSFVDLQGKKYLARKSSNEENLLYCTKL